MLPSHYFCLAVQIQVDTGSADLWIQDPRVQLQTTNVTNITVQDQFGIGDIEGQIAFGKVELGPYTVENQAFLVVNQVCGAELMIITR